MNLIFNILPEINSFYLVYQYVSSCKSNCIKVTVQLKNPIPNLEKIKIFVATVSKNGLSIFYPSLKMHYLPKLLFNLKRLKAKEIHIVI